MAKQQETVFQGLSRALKGNKPAANMPEPQHGAIFGPKVGPGKSKVDVQQDFLNWQIVKIAADLYGRTMYQDVDRISAYQDFRAMDHSPEIARALDIIRDECLTRNANGNILEIYSENARIKQELTYLFKKTLDIEYNLRLWIRDLVKFGDYFVHLHVDKDSGVVDYMTLPMEEIHREEGYDGQIDSVRFRWETSNQFFEDWQVAHFSLRDDTRRLPYGRSILDPARKLWKQLQLAEDAMLVYRVSRAPEKRVFFIEVGNIPPEDIAQYIQKMQNQIKKQPIVDPNSGKINMKHNPMNVEEDFFIPIRNGISSKIETLPGAANLDQIQDIEYLQNKLFTAIQVPKTYLNYAEAMQGGSTLSQSDLRFSRTINSIQEVVLKELRRMANIHLYLMGFEDDLDNFTLNLTNPSTQQELLKLETMQKRIEVFKEYFTPEATSPLSYVMAMEKILGYSKSEIKLILRQKKVEKKLFNEIDTAVETYGKTGLFKDLDDKYELDGVLPAAGGGESADDEGGGFGGGGGGGSFGGASALGGDLGGDEIAGDAGAEAGGEGGGAEVGGEEPEEEPLSETRYVRTKNGIKKVKIIVEDYDELMDELISLEEDKAESVYVRETLVEDVELFDSNKAMNLNTKKLLQSLDEKFNSDDD